MDEYNNIVIAGLWNKYVFTAEWDKKFLFQGDEVEVEFPLDPNSSERVSSKELRINIEGQRLCIVCRKQEDPIFLSAKEIAIKIADYVPHTPVSAFGINFKLAQSLTVELIKKLTMPDNDNIKSIYGTISNTQVSRQMNLDGAILTVRQDITSENVEFNFNFHFPVISLLDVKEKLSAIDILKLKLDSLKYLETIYDLKLGE